MKTERAQRWQMNLAEFHRTKASEPFAWGLNDCCLFAADAVLAMTGEDFAKEWRGAYDSALSAERLLKSLGGLEALATSALGDPVSVLWAGVGDVVLIRNEGRELLAICNGTEAIGPGESGLVSLGMSDALLAWKVG